MSARMRDATNMRIDICFLSGNPDNSLDSFNCKFSACSGKKIIIIVSYSFLKISVAGSFISYFDSRNVCTYVDNFFFPSRKKKEELQNIRNYLGRAPN